MNLKVQVNNSSEQRATIHLNIARVILVSDLAGIRGQKHVSQDGRRDMAVLSKTIEHIGFALAVLADSPNVDPEFQTELPFDK